MEPEYLEISFFEEKTSLPFSDIVFNTREIFGQTLLRDCRCVNNCIISIEKIVIDNNYSILNDITVSYNTVASKNINLSLLSKFPGCETNENEITINVYPHIFGFYYLMSDTYNNILSFKSKLTKYKIIYKIFKLNEEIKSDSISIYNHNYLFSRSTNKSNYHSGMFIMNYENISEILVNGHVCNDIFIISPFVIYVSFNGVNYDRTGRNIYIESFDINTITDQSENIPVYFFKNSKLYIGRNTRFINDGSRNISYHSDEEIIETFEINKTIINVKHLPDNIFL